MIHIFGLWTRAQLKRQPRRKMSCGLKNPPFCVRDAFNGFILWEHSIPRELPEMNVVEMGNCTYVIEETAVTATSH